MSLKNFMSLEGLDIRHSRFGGRHFRLVRESVSLLSLLVLLGGLAACGTVSSSDASDGNSGAHTEGDVNSGIAYGEITDERDGQVYKTVVIGSQTWMAENLNYETETSSCYNYDADKCAEYGQLYTMDDAMGRTEDQGICPSGWHLPTTAEWNTLLEHGNQEKLKSKTGWYLGNGTDDYGFSILPSGMYYEGAFYDDGYNFRFWTIDEDDEDDLMSLGLFRNMLLFAGYAEDEYAKYSVRCLMNGEKISSSSQAELSSSSWFEDGDDENDSFSSSSRGTGKTGKSSSSSGKLSSSESKTAWDYLNPEIDYGEMVDERDGQVYKTVVIGTQTWMAQNLNYETENSLCYQKDASKCAIYGRLYTWFTAVGVDEDECDDENGCELGTGNVQGICPDGWHLPTSEEWDMLFNAAGRMSAAGIEMDGNNVAGTLLKSESGWIDKGYANLDYFGFSALPAGYYNKLITLYTFRHEGDETYFWSASVEYYSEDEVYMVDFVSLETDSNEAFMYSYDIDDVKGSGSSVRCLKD